MELEEVVQSRRMVRTFDPDRAVPVAFIDRALEAATRAPSAGFSQGWDFVVLTATQDRDAFWDSAAPSGALETPDRWLRGVRAAPCLIVCCSDPDRYRRRYAEPDKAVADPNAAVPEVHSWPIPYWDVDTGMAALLMLLTGVDAGLGGLFFGIPDTRHWGVAAALGIPRDRRLVGVVGLGYPLPDVRSPSLKRGRRPLAEVAHAGRFGVPWGLPASASTTPTTAQADSTSSGIIALAPSQ